jgi:hypothetical protein
MKKLLVTIALGATLASTQAGAQAPGDRRGAQPDVTRQQAQERADGLFQMLDLNHDGVLTRAEAEQAGAQLQAQRATSGRDVAPGLGGHTARYLEQSFAGAQSVTLQQFEQAMLTHFDQMDVNHDGVLTAAERSQSRANRSGGN